MRWLRMVLGVAGVAAAAWGCRLLWPALTAAPRDTVSVATWLLGGPVLHDAVLAPVVGLVGVALTALLPRSLRAAVAAGLVVSAVLTLIALPELLRPAAGPPNPGLSDRDYPLGLASALVAVWLLVGITVLIGRRRQPAGNQVVAPF